MRLHSSYKLASTISGDLTGDVTTLPTVKDILCAHSLYMYVTSFYKVSYKEMD